MDRIKNNEQENARRWKTKWQGNGGKTGGNKQNRKRETRRWRMRQ